MAYLTVINVKKQFKGLVAVNNVSFEVEKGEIVGLIGPNGAGKSTLFALISGFIEPTQGEIYFKGENITGLKPFVSCSKGLVRTFQIVQIFPDLTVLDNVKPAAYLHAKNSQEAEQITLEALKLIAKALATQAELILLDEVMAGLTPVEAQVIVGKIRELNREKNITFIIVEHLLEALMSVSDRVVVLNYGELIVSGTPDERVQVKNYSKTLKQKKRI
ncbi:amino acid/amide ABC transporter ATP-binding protein 1, HAAT family [Rhizophagus irregularis]|uniref:Amino acid/amide ABC transporter ATP-binding protein 1, HAAT family n=1 Tax=Rhizophagus irregularis TaxID=588596 RepID=A0A2N0QPK7_9GLOM|nr:amino acid/amide ABC transporter ATP-binding protein 1, HAAT family [Rhizophagus irregularis]